MSSPIFIHVLSLDTVGGVESLYVHFLKKALSQRDFVHYTCVSGKPPHPKFAALLHQTGHKPFLEQYMMRIRLPHWLNIVTHFRRAIIEDIVKPTSWVFWNRIETKIPPGAAVYYEHGASWTLTPTKKRKEFLHHCSSVIANSEAAAVMLRKRWEVTSPITVVPNPLRPDISFAASPREGLFSKPVRLGFIGRLVPIKAPLIPLFVLKKLLEQKIPTTLSVAGEGVLAPTMIATAKRLGVESSTHFVGCTSDVCSWLDSIDILLVPSIREPLGLVSLEAAARGIPVIAAHVDGLAEVVSHEKTGFLVEPTIEIHKAGPLVTDISSLPEAVVSPLLKELMPPKVVDPNDCVKLIHRFLNDPSLYESCSAHALESAHRRSSFDFYYSAIKSILENSQDMIK